MARDSPSRQPSRYKMPPIIAMGRNPALDLEWVKYRNTQAARETQMPIQFFQPLCVNRNRMMVMAQIAPAIFLWP